jgi:thioredoxin-dependent peroxiredoxin
MKMFFLAPILVMLFCCTELFAIGDTMMLKKGQMAPEFSLVSSSGDTVRLSDFKGKNNVVLIFYPGDNTPGCTKQLCAVRDDYAGFQAKNAKVFGINPGNGASHKKFIANHSFQFPLLIDEGRKTAREYGCDGLIFVKRTVFVINREGTIVYTKRGMPSDKEILDTIPETEKK